jgi:hypothetical protein
MQDAASVLTDHFPDLLARLLAGLDLDRLALETQAIQRKRELVGGAALLRELRWNLGDAVIRRRSALACW